jgi:hypothetical protein
MKDLEADLKKEDSKDAAIPLTYGPANFPNRKVANDSGHEGRFENNLSDKDRRIARKEVRKHDPKNRRILPIKRNPKVLLPVKVRERGMKGVAKEAVNGKGNKSSNLSSRSSVPGPVIEITIDRPWFFSIDTFTIRRTGVSNRSDLKEFDLGNTS